MYFGLLQVLNALDGFPDVLVVILFLGPRDLKLLDGGGGGRGGERCACESLTCYISVITSVRVSVVR